MIKFAILLILIIALIYCRLYFAYISLTTKRDRTLDLYNSLDIPLKKRYSLMQNILDNAQQYIPEQQKIISQASKLIPDLMTMENKPENIDRRLAYEYELAKLMKQICTSMLEKGQEENTQINRTAIDEYCQLEESIKQAKKSYNSAANDLKTAVEVFPSSFIARLKEIKRFDFFRE